MKILRILSAALALLLLAACAAPVEPGYSEDPTTQAETTSPPLELAFEEANGITWQEVDLHEEANADIRAWAEAHYGASRVLAREHRLNDTMVLFGCAEHCEWNMFYVIRLRDEATGEVRTLIDPTNGDPSRYHSSTAFVEHVINERYFIYRLALPETCGVGPQTLFDIERELSIPIAPEHDVTPLFQLVYDDVMYFLDRSNGMHGGPEYTHLFAVPIAALDGVTTLEVGENLLAGFPQEDTRQTGGTRRLLSLDARYLVKWECCCSREQSNLRVFDLRQQSVTNLGDIHDPQRHGWVAAFRNARTMYIFGAEATWDGAELQDVHTDRFALKITLP